MFAIQNNQEFIIKMQSLQLILKRINKECQQIQQKPIQNIMVSIKTERQIHFCLYGLQKPYSGGFYHGVLQLPENYPFSAPKFKFFTNNGRFQVGKYVCTTFTSYHQEAWSSSWTIRTILTAILSFFLSDEIGYGALQQTSNKRSEIARKTLDLNLEDKQFKELFGQQLILKGIHHQKLNQNKQKNEQKSQEIIELSQINSALNDVINKDKENIESMMLPQVNNNAERRQRINGNKVLKVLYGSLMVILLVIVFVKL